MHGRFNSPLYFNHGLDQLDICGPIQWGSGDSGKHLKIYVEITQDGHTWYADSHGDEFSPPQPEWMVYLNNHSGPAPHIRPGQAFARAKAVDRDGVIANEWSNFLVIEAAVTFALAQRIAFDVNNDGGLAKPGEAPPGESWPELAAAPWPELEPAPEEAY